MKKERKFKKWVNYIIFITTCFLIVFVGSIDDFELSFIPYLFGMVGLIILNINLLRKYGDLSLFFEDCEEKPLD